MTGRQLKEYRRRSRLTQEDAAAALGISQTYLSLLEGNKRPLTESLRRKAVRKLHGSAVELPAKAVAHSVATVSDDRLAAELAGLGYPGFSHLKGASKMNPADVLLAALHSDRRGARIIEALPWLMIKYSAMGWNDVVVTAKVHDLQNRLGYVTHVARKMAERYGDPATVIRLKTVEETLQRSKLARVETLCKETMTVTERDWLKRNRPRAAKFWHLLTDLSPQHLNPDHYAAS